MNNDVQKKRNIGRTTLIVQENENDSEKNENKNKRFKIVR